MPLGIIGKAISYNHPDSPAQHEHLYQYCGIHIGYRDNVVLCCACGDVKFVPTPVKEGEQCLNL